MTLEKLILYKYLVTLTQLSHKLLHVCLLNRPAVIESVLVKQLR